MTTTKARKNDGDRVLFRAGQVAVEIGAAADLVNDADRLLFRVAPAFLSGGRGQATDENRWPEESAHEIVSRATEKLKSYDMLRKLYKLLTVWPWALDAQWRRRGAQ